MKIKPHLKPVYANLLRLDIGKYLISPAFKHLLLEENLDSLWQNCLDFVSQESNVVIMTPGYTGDATEAFGYFLDQIFLQVTPGEFCEIVKSILVDFKNWKGQNLDIEKVIESLQKIGIEKEELEKIFINLIENKTILPTISDVAPQFNDNKMIVDEKLCFVLIPFTSKFDSIYSNIIKKVVESEFNFNCKKADEIFGTKPIIEDIWEYIKNAKFLIADLTDRNPNVFYELGIAHALNKQVVLLTQNINDVPFDLRHFRCVVYEDSIAGADKLRDGLKSTIKKVLE